MSRATERHQRSRLLREMHDLKMEPWGEATQRLTGLGSPESKVVELLGGVGGGLTGLKTS